MKKYFLPILLLLTCQYAAAYDDFSNNGWFLGITSATGWVQNGDRGLSDSSWAKSSHLSSSAGYRFQNGWRPELEIAFRNGNDSFTIGFIDPEFDTPAYELHCHEHVQSASMMSNLVYDFGEIVYEIKPYIGGGVGVVNIKREIQLKDIIGNSTKAAERRKSFAFQVFSGVAYPIYDLYEISLDYKFFKSVSEQIHVSTIDDKGTHSICCGLKRFF